MPLQYGEHYQRRDDYGGHSDESSSEYGNIVPPTLRLARESMFPDERLVMKRNHSYMSLHVSPLAPLVSCQKRPSTGAPYVVGSEFQLKIDILLYLLYTLDNIYI